MNNEITKLLVTGGSGFLGRHLVKALKTNYSIDLLDRRKTLNSETTTFISDFSKNANYRDALKNKDAVIHCAAKVHAMREDDSNSLQVFREINCCTTLKLAEQAAEAGVKRFIFISSIKVNGENTKGEPFTAHDELNPLDAYSISKAEAEEKLLILAKSTVMDVVIIRPPMIYGKGVKGNFSLLAKLIKRNVVLPLGSVKKNSRSIVYIDNLISLIACSISHEAAKNQVFLVSDYESLSTERLLRIMITESDSNTKLIPFPLSLLKIIGKLTGNQKKIERLTGSLEIDMTKTMNLLQWKPPFSTEQGISLTLKD